MDRNDDIAMNKSPKSAPRRVRERKPVTGNWNPDWEPFAKLDPAWTEKVIAMAIAPAVAGVARCEDDRADRHRARRLVHEHVRAGRAPAHPARAQGRRDDARKSPPCCSSPACKGLHSMCLGAPILLEELEAREQRAG